MYQFIKTIVVFNDYNEYNWILRKFIFLIQYHNDFHQWYKIQCWNFEIIQKSIIQWTYYSK